MGGELLNVYYELFYNAPIGYALFDQEFRLLKGNTAFSKMIGKSEGQLLGSKFTDFICSANFLEFCIAVESIIKDKDTKIVRLVLKTSDLKAYVNISCNAIKIDNQDLIACNLIDITEEKQLSDELHHLSFHDQLTDLYNRRFFVEEVKRLDVKRNLPLTVVMADVNGLKLINDSFGHKYGDELLVKVAKAIKDGCRSDDIIARIGGDEFVILLPKTDANAATLIIDRIKENLKFEKVRSLEISVSFGLSTKNNEEEDFADIYRSSEEAMYRRKLFESPSMRSKAIDTVIAAFYKISEVEERHSKSVGALCRKFAKALDYNGYQIKELETIGFLHDIGKIGIDNEILKKPNEALSTREWEDINRHPEIGYQIVGAVHEMKDVAHIILSHHERWDGTGYPKGLKGEDIPRRARILAICDAYDFMISDRIYSEAKGKDYAINEIIKNAGTQFDPDLSRVFVEKVLGREWKNSEQ